MASTFDPAPAFPLVLPHQHALSLRLAAQNIDLSRSLPASVLSCSVVSPGVVELTLQAADGTRGYGTRQWRFRIGGPGLMLSLPTSRFTVFRLPTLFSPTAAVMASTFDPAPAFPLVLPHQHALSLRLAAQNIDLSRSLPASVLSCSVVSPGVVELTLQAADGTRGYGTRQWRFRVGGPGLGDAPDIAAMLGSEPRAPLAARFTSPLMSMHDVDESGMVGASFWRDAEASVAAADSGPTLRAVAETAAAWLEGTHLGSPAAWRREYERADADLARAVAAWEKARAHTFDKVAVVRRYRDRCACPALLRGIFLPEWIAPAFRPLMGLAREASVEAEVGAGTSSAASTPGPSDRWRSLVTEISPGIFAFDLFTPLVCDLIAAEVDRFEAGDLPRRRPNTMNRLGMVVNEIGLEPLMTELLERLVAPLCAALYPAEMVTCALDSHHSFVVQYKANGSDAGLDMHHDASEATLNVCLGREFRGAGLRFCGSFGSEDHRRLQHVHGHHVGQAVLHLGRHRHGADDISSGERMNLIVWARNSAYRAAAAFGHVQVDGYPRKPEEGRPDQLCLSRANDRDYEEQISKKLKR